MTVLERREPCMYTIKEIRKFLPKREKNIAEDKGIPHDEVMKEYYISGSELKNRLHRKIDTLFKK